MSNPIHHGHQARMRRCLNDSSREVEADGAARSTQLSSSGHPRSKAKAPAFDSDSHRLPPHQNKKITLSNATVEDSPRAPIVGKLHGPAVGVLENLPQPLFRGSSTKPKQPFGGERGDSPPAKQSKREACQSDADTILQLSPKHAPKQLSVVPVLGEAQEQEGMVMESVMPLSATMPPSSPSKSPGVYCIPVLWFAISVWFFVSPKPRPKQSVASRCAFLWGPDIDRATLT